MNVWIARSDGIRTRVNMEEAVLLVNLTYLLLIAGVCSITFSKLKMPAIIGYLAAGIILANYWGGASESTEILVSILSDMGLVLLMFFIGLELNLQKLKKSGMFVVMVAVIQLPLMLIAGYTVGILMGWDMVQSVFLGAVISGSSTAVITAVLKEQEYIDKDAAETIILITVMEDIGQVLILTMAAPLLVGDTPAVGSIIGMVVAIVVFIAASIGIGLIFIPKILDWIGKKISSEVLLIVSIGLCFAMALLSTKIGLSMAIGAFIMGVIVSQCKFSHDIMAKTEPMKELFMAIFFISIGLEIVPSELLDNIPLILIIFGVFVIAKILTVLLGYLLGNKTLRISFMSAVSLAAMGEFSFIIAKTALDAGVVGQNFYSAVIGAALVSMVVLPLLSKSSSKIYDKVAAKTPESVHNAVMKMSSARSDAYDRAKSSKRSAMLVRSKLIMVYIDLIVIAVIEIAFYFVSPYIYENLDPMLPGTIHIANSILMVINFLVLLPPIINLVHNLKLIDGVMVEGGNKRRHRTENQDSNMYEKFMKLSSILLILTIDFLVLLIVPNPLVLWEQIAVILICLSVFVALLFRGIPRGKYAAANERISNKFKKKK